MRWLSPLIFSRHSAIFAAELLNICRLSLRAALSIALFSHTPEIHPADS
jgi:hypothetical protein